MANCTVSGTVLDPSGTAISGVRVEFNTQTAAASVEPQQAATTTATNGTWSLVLVQGLGGIFTIKIPQSSIAPVTPYTFNANIPVATTATFASVVVD